MSSARIDSGEVGLFRSCLFVRMWVFVGGGVNVVVCVLYVRGCMCTIYMCAWVGM